MHSTSATYIHYIFPSSLPLTGCGCGCRMCSRGKRCKTFLYAACGSMIQLSMRPRSMIFALLRVCGCIYICLYLCSTHAVARTCSCMTNTRTSKRTRHTRVRVCACRRLARTSSSRIHTHTHTHTHTHKRAQALGKDKELKDQAERMQNHALHLASLAAERDRALEEVPQCVSMCPCVSPQPWPLASIAAPRSSPFRHLYSLSGWVRSLPSALPRAQPGSALRLR